MIYIDASRYSNIRQRTGVENYSYCLINELLKLDSAITLVTPKPLGQLSAKQLVIPFPRLWTQLRLSWEVLTNRKIKKLFIPSHLMPLVHPKKTIITIHDVAFKRYPEAYSLFSRWYLNWGAWFAVRRAYKIIVPSKITKDDLIQFYGANPEKITVIPLGFSERSAISDQRSAKILRKYDLNKNKYFIFVGRIETKKSIKTLVQAFAQFVKKHPDYKLVLAGKPGVGYDKIMSEAGTRHGASVRGLNVVMTGYVSDEEKQALMQGAFCFVFPSLFEGFGLPLLEAMSVGLPIIASDIPSSREVMGSQALFFHPENTALLARHMETMITDSELRKKLTENYQKRLQYFKWERCAKEVWAVLNGGKSI